MELLESRETIECYSFLGYEVVRTVLDLHAMHCYSLKKEPDYSNVTKELTSGPDRLISDELLKGMGIVRQAELVKAGADSLQVRGLGAGHEDLRRQACAESAS